MLERQTGHLMRLVDDLLDVSRITSGKIELRRRPLELVDAVLRAMEIVGPVLEMRAHRVDMQGVPRTGLVVDADLVRLAQVIANLLTNAAKYSEPGSLITLRAGKGGERVWLSVTDSGAGIAPDMIGRIFELFVQQSQTLERSHGGLGLGLAIVKSLVEMHGGSVHARSEGIGLGSEFRVELPASAAPAALDRARLPPPRHASHGKRILVVDDNLDAGSALAELLKVLGHEAYLAHDGADALRKAARLNPEIALIDIGLPEMDGYELAARLRQQSAPGHAPLMVAVTGYGMESDRERSARAGFSAHLVKPLDLATIERLFSEG
jgi:CheY-like chemotaxis protein